jgi:DHA1 family bicyclomycin/chloramphenicol resistance-like MFS transporter
MAASSPPAASGAPRAVSHGLAAVALALLLGLQPITTDVYLPALPTLTRALGAPMSAAQLTMSALMFAFGLAQLFWGPVADRVGRRPVLLWGLSLYTLASIGSAVAGSIEALIVWRVLQGACLAAAVVVARAIVRDLYEPHEGARVMALALSGLGVIAIAGPLLGGMAAAVAGWRTTLSLMALAGAATLVFVAWRLPETLLHRNPRATALAPLAAAWWQIARHHHFVAWTLLTSCTYGGLFTILAGSSFVYMDMLGLSAAAYGAAMASGSVAYLLGTLLCRRWIVRHGLVGAVTRGAGVTLAGGLLIAGLALAGVNAVWAVLLPQWLFCFGHGIHQPCGQAGAVGPFPRTAGAASALAGFVLALVAFVVGRWLGAVLADEVLPYALGVAFWALATSLVGWTLVRRLATN